MDSGVRKLGVQKRRESFWLLFYIIMLRNKVKEILENFMVNKMSRRKGIIIRKLKGKIYYFIKREE